MFFWLHRAYILHLDLSSLLSRYRSLRHTCASVTTNMRDIFFGAVHQQCSRHPKPFAAQGTYLRPSQLLHTEWKWEVPITLGSELQNWSRLPTNGRQISRRSCQETRKFSALGPYGLERVAAWTQPLGYCTQNNQHSLYFGVFRTYHFNYMDHADLGIHMWVFHCH